MIRPALERILREFPDARHEPFAGHPLARYIAADVPRVLGRAVTAWQGITPSASPGKGNWGTAPWIAFFDPIITETAQEGFYPVYLFSEEGDAVFLSLNQGVTSLRRELGTDAARALLRSRATILLARLVGVYERHFTAQPIRLIPRNNGSLLGLYQVGHVLGKRYLADRLPEEAALRADLSAMLDLYRIAIARGGASDLRQDSDDFSDESDAELPGTFEEGRRYRYHRRLERNSKLAREAKRIHGFVCQVCGFDFRTAYGTLGEEYIEAHHKTPLSQLAENEVVSRSPRDDFAVLCANCHRMIHRAAAPSPYDAFRDFYRNQRKA
ncbi:MAG TPA: DUF3578 domain-containing protein [Planctomycetota bacterium]|jgi:5-methylcytosine-specific restriction protein A|nr:DUF3578 domain-containing protein [Planctomycetota bacterium]